MAQKKAVVSKEKVDAKKHTSSSKRSTLKAVGSIPKNSDQETPHAKHIGDVLKLVRESRSESIKEIGDTLRIGERYLSAIESLKTEDLPEQVYTLGFVRSYAHYLGVDPQKSVTQFKTEVYATTPSTKKFSVPKPVSSAPLPTKKVLWGVTIAFLTFLGIAYVQWGASSAPSLDQEISNLLKPIEVVTPVAEEAIAGPSFGRVTAVIEDRTPQGSEKKSVEIVE